MSCSVPVAFFIYRRPDCTLRVFEQIKAVRPSKLLLVADGPRSPEENELCDRSREVLTKIDWDCEVQTLFAEQNLGCKARMVSGLRWVFEQVPEAIILEDDCLPSEEFFSFCECLLARYRHEDRVALISGCNFQDGQIMGDASYYFSRYAHVWGWASWRRTWMHYDAEMATWPHARRSLFPHIPFSKQEKHYWKNVFDMMHAQRMDTWDYQLMYSLFFHNQVSIIPNANLISNIGFREDATHTMAPSPFANLRRDSLGVFKHPSEILPHTSADHQIFLRMFAPHAQSARPLTERVRQKLSSLWNALP